MLLKDILNIVNKFFIFGKRPCLVKKSSVQDLININMPRIRRALDNKTRNRKNGLLFGTWNVRTLFKPGAAQNIVKEIEKYKLKIVALQ